LQDLVVAIREKGRFLAVQHRRQKVQRSVALIKKARDSVLEGDCTL
jgi:hypothetical protein